MSNDFFFFFFLNNFWPEKGLLDNQAPWVKVSPNSFPQGREKERSHVRRPKFKLYFISSMGNFKQTIFSLCFIYAHGKWAQKSNINLIVLLERNILRRLSVKCKASQEWQHVESSIISPEAVRWPGPGLGRHRHQGSSTSGSAAQNFITVPNQTLSPTDLFQGRDGGGRL